MKINSSNTEIVLTLTQNAQENLLRYCKNFDSICGTEQEFVVRLDFATEVNYVDETTGEPIQEFNRFTVGASYLGEAGEGIEFFFQGYRCQINTHNYMIKSKEILLDFDRVFQLVNVA